MATTFIQITNRILRRVNEVELTVDNFDSARGLHVSVKDSVNDAIRRINRKPGNWPWNADSDTITLVPGKSEYEWPLDFKSVDWNTFQIQKGDGWSFNTLDPIERDMWYEDFRDQDLENSNSWREPIYVFEGHGSTFGVSPIPDKPYVLKFRYYTNDSELTDASDLLPLPDQWSDIVFYHCVAQVAALKDDIEKVQMYEQMFKEALNEMSTILLHRGDSFRDTRIRHYGRTKSII